MPDSSTVESYDEIKKEVEKMQSANPRVREESLENLYEISREIGSAITVNYMFPFIKTILDTNEQAKRPVLHQLDKIIRDLIKDAIVAFPIYKEIFLTRNDDVRKEAANVLVCEVFHLGESSESFESNLLQLESFICAVGESRFIMHRLSAVCLVREFLVNNKGKAKIQKIDKLFARLLSDCASVVRKRAVSSQRILSCLYTPKELMELAEKTLHDPEDSVRCYFTLPLSLLSDSDSSPSFFSKLFKLASKDLSWQVRSSAVRILKEVVKYVYSEAPEEGPSVINCIELLVEDKEEIVRKKVMEQMPGILRQIPQTREKILRFIDKSSRDRSNTVRQVVPHVLSEVAESLSKEDVQLYALPIIQRLLIDGDRETKMETISKLKSLYTKLGSAAIADALTPVISDLESSNWRTRLAVLKSIASLSTQIEKEYFKIHLKDSFFKMFIDSVWMVRKEAACIISEISLAFGPEWVLTEALPSLEFLKDSQNYMHRIAYATAAGEMLRDAWPAPVSAQLRENIGLLSKDSVPQVRLSVAKAVQKSSLEDKEQILELLQGDPHPEVRRVAKEIGKEWRGGGAEKNKKNYK